PRRCTAVPRAGFALRSTARNRSGRRSRARPFSRVSETSVPPLLAGSGLRGPIVARRKPQCERRALPDFAFHGDRAVKLFNDALGDGKSKAKAATLGCDEILENRAEAIRRNAGSGVGDGNFDQIADA